ncbi:MAG: ribonuclease H [Desulfobacteraceae bacterium]|nr:MAG: ribonuclease H [Desulfobacteraceae bacterium]
MHTLSLFTDVSCNPKFQIGFGAYLLVADLDLNADRMELIKDRVKYKKFDFTSSTKLEIETLLWALQEVKKIIPKSDWPVRLTLYTDSQGLAGLPDRRAKLEQLNFKSIGKNRELNQAALYRKFYRASDRWQFKVVKLKGHFKSLKKDTFQTLFTYVDKRSRKELKSYLKENPLLNTIRDSLISI